MAPLQDAAAADELAVLINRHERKSGGEVGDSGRGSSAFAGAVDIVLSLRRGEGNTSPTVRVIRALSRFDETPAELVIDYVDGGYRALGSEQDVKAQEAREKILAALPTAEGEAIPFKDLLEAVKVPRTTAQPAIDGFLGDGTVQRTGAGKWGDPYRYWRPAGKLSADLRVEVSAESDPGGAAGNGLAGLSPAAAKKPSAPTNEYTPQPENFCRNLNS
jgi:hypothetical protein